MKTNLLSKEKNVAKFTMEFTAEEFDQACIDAYKATKDQFSIDGFRKGKAPRSIIEKHYGEGVFFEEAVNQLFQQNYLNAVQELDLDIIDSPAAEFSEIGKGKPMTITITVPVYPVVEVKDYMGVEAEQEKAQVSDESVQAEIDNMLKRNARMITVDRESKNGDTLIFDFKGFVDGEQFEGGTAERHELKLGSGMFIPGFEEQLEGLKAGESKNVEVKFPENYTEELAGKDATFECLVHEVKEEEIPELDDEFVKDVSEFDTVDELKEDIKKRQLENAKNMVVSRAKDAVVSKVYENNPVDVPDVMVEDEINRMIQEIGQQLSYQGLTVENYLQYMGKDMSEMRNELREDAAKKVGTRIVLMSIIDKENIEVSEEEMEAELAKIAEAYKRDVEEIKNMIGIENLTYFQKDVQITKAIDMLYDNAKIKEVEPKKVDPVEIKDDEKSEKTGDEKTEEK
ncbi:MAG: trigger factor [Clostridiales bacterium]|nr:trigger factor [Clostridiales bacterium]MDY6117012.1 trigger factor [Anaerovoracaceae bacterium]